MKFLILAAALKLFAIAWKKNPFASESKPTLCQLKCSINIIAASTSTSDVEITLHRCGNSSLSRSNCELAIATCSKSNLPATGDTVLVTVEHAKPTTAMALPSRSPLIALPTRFCNPRVTTVLPQASEGCSINSIWYPGRTLVC